MRGEKKASSRSHVAALQAEEASRGALSKALEVTRTRASKRNNTWKAGTKEAAAKKRRQRGERKPLLAGGERRPVKKRRRKIAAGSRRRSHVLI